ncbi:MAG: porin family protein [Gammaproteobacteria bacterium]|nr:porin family protein [Gammaproteobacteria bacterium]MDH3856911.1 porin family protein [Gammaproteobacteria bacterium]
MTSELRKYLTHLSFVLLFGTTVTTALADEHQPLLDRNLFSIGVGISSNSIDTKKNDEDDEVGFQFFGAYDLVEINLMEGVNSSVEFGLMDYGFKRDSTGVWATYTVDGIISGDLGWLARAGFDIGDDSGLMIGAGLSYIMDERKELRFEYVARDDVDSLQFNFLYHL